ncbi:MAG: hypothetical protein GX557_13000, partial [Chloroflexi bacterium]|nr:hypothetical protein [Chloroflexota bacterium]
MESIAFERTASGYSLALGHGITIHDARLWLQAEGERIDCLAGADPGESGPRAGLLGDCELRTYTATALQDRLTLRTRFELYADRALVTLEITNRSEQSITLGRCYLLALSEESRFELGCAAADVNVSCHGAFWNPGNVVLPLNADTDPKLYGPVWNDGFMPFEPGKHRSLIQGVLHNKLTDAFLNASFLTFDRANCLIHYWARDGAPAVECFCDLHDYALAPGQTLASETLRVRASLGAHDTLVTWAEDVAAHYQPRFLPRVALGALGETSWRDPLAGQYQEIVLSNARAIAERLKGFGVQYYWVSIANLKDGTPGNWLEDDYSNLPDGLAELARKLQSYGLQLGLWIAPFWIPDRFSTQAEEQDEQILRRGGERVIEVKKWLRGISGEHPPEERLTFFARDGSQPAAQAYVRSVFEAYRALGVRYYMVDFTWCGAGNVHGPFDYDGYYDKRMIAGPEVFRALMKVVREAAGPDTYLLGSTGPTLTCIGCLDAVRTGPDIGEGRQPRKGFAEYPATYISSNWRMFVGACKNYALNYHTHGRLYHADSFNVITLDKPIPLSEARISVSMSALASSAMMFGDHVGELGEERLALLKKALPQNHGECAVPLDLYDCEFPEVPGVYHLAVKRRWGAYSVLGLLNLTEQPRAFSIDLARLGYRGACVVYDFWDERFVGLREGALQQTVAPHTITVLRIAPFEARPQLLSTDMHVLQGAVEVTHVRWKDLALYVSCTRPAGESGTVSLL